MYLVPAEVPEYCNKCPFGYCSYSFPTVGSCTSMIDGKKNKTGTYGYVCNIDFYKNKKYTKILRANTEEDIKKPGWCGLEEVIQ